MDIRKIRKKNLGQIRRVTLEEPSVVTCPPALRRIVFDPRVGNLRVSLIQASRLKDDGWDLNNRLHLARRTGAREAEMFGGVLVLHWFAG